MNDIDSVSFYRHSGKFSPLAPVLVLAIAALAALPLGFIYGYLILWNPIVYVSFIATVIYGFIFAFIGTLVIKKARVRNVPMAAMLALLMGLIGLYGAWFGYNHAVMLRMLEANGGEAFVMLLNPVHMMGLISAIYEEGVWSFKGTNVSGLALGAIWLIEAGIIVVIPVVSVKSAIATTPYCEMAGVWLDDDNTIDTLARLSEEDRQSFANGSLEALTRIKPRSENAKTWTRLTLKSSPQSDHLRTLTVSDARVEVNKDNKVTIKTDDICRGLILSNEMFALMAEFRKLKPLKQVRRKKGASEASEPEETPDLDEDPTQAEVK